MSKKSEQLIDALIESVDVGTKADRVDEWVSYSMTSHPFEELRNRVLTDVDSVCYTYLCRNNPMNEEEIIELSILSFGIIQKKYYEEDYPKVRKAIDSIWGIVTSESEEYIDTFEIHNKSGTTTIYKTSILKDRLDWFTILHYQPLSEEFVKKYRTLFKCKYSKASAEANLARQLGYDSNFKYLKNDIVIFNDSYDDDSESLLEFDFTEIDNYIEN